MQLSLPTRTIPLGVLCFLLLFGATAKTPLWAQTADDTWETPVNLSQSGTAGKLVVTTGSDGQILLLWQDALEGFMVAEQDGAGWTGPQNVRLPFSEPAFATPDGTAGSSQAALFTPSLLVDDKQQLHGFWRNETGNVLYSRVALADLAVPEAWSAPVVLAESAVSLDAALGANGQLHLVMMMARSTEEFPAGIYYRRSEDGGVSWTEAASLYQSDYLRTLTGDQARLQMVVNEADHGFVVWDNPALDSVFVVRSPNGGVGWTAPVVVDQREPGDNAEAPGPSLIDVAVHESEVHLSWQATHGNEGCARYHQVSLDRGENWQPRQVAVSNELACPTTAHLLVDGNGVVFLLTVVMEQAFLQAWDGVMWSEARGQTAVPNFTNPLTNRLITDTCIYPQIASNNRLLVFGCGVSTNGVLNVKDIWVRERPLGSLKDWFMMQNMAWSNPAPLSTGQTELSTPFLLADQEGFFHAFWVGSHTTRGAETPVAIFYAHWNGTFWSRSAPVLAVMADQITAAVDHNNNLLVVWRDPIQDTLLFSRVERGQAMFPLEWSTPQTLPIEQSTVSWPTILVDAENQIHVAYVAPLNEGRGIYLVQSQDGGITWSAPLTLFDAEAVDWSMIGRLYMIQTENGDFHALWQQLALPVGREPLALYYANSQDKGQTWSEAAFIIANPAQWSRVVSAGPQTVFLLWQETNQGRLGLWYQQSVDSGQTWDQPALVTSFGNFSQATDVIADRAGQLHLLKMRTEDLNRPVLRQWIWQGNNWLSEEDVSLFSPTLAGTETKLAMVINDNGRLTVVYSRSVSHPETLETIYSLHYIERLIELPEDAIATPVPLVVAAPTVSMPTETPIPEPLPTERSNFAAEEGSASNGPIPDTLAGNLLVGIFPAALIIGGVVIFSLYFSRLRKNS